MGNTENVIQEDNKYLKEYSILHVGIFAGIVSGIGYLITFFNISSLEWFSDLIWTLFDVVLIFIWANTANAILNEKNDMPYLLAIIVGIAGGLDALATLMANKATLITNTASIISFAITWSALLYLIIKIWRRSLWMTMPEQGCVKYLFSCIWVKQIFGSKTGNMQIVGLGYLVFYSFLWVLSVVMNCLFGETDSEPLSDGQMFFWFLFSVFMCLVVTLRYISIQYLFNSAVRVYKEPPTKPSCCNKNDVIISCVLFGILFSVLFAFVILGFIVIFVMIDSGIGDKMANNGDLGKISYGLRRLWIVIFGAGGLLAGAVATQKNKKK